MVRSARGGSGQERVVERGGVNLAERVIAGIELEVVRVGTEYRAVLLGQMLWAFLCVRTCNGRQELDRSLTRQSLKGRQVFK